MADDAKMEAEIEQAFRTGDPEAAARVIMSHKNCSLTDARKEVHERLKARTKR
jgi:hypothetical protein